MLKFWKFHLQRVASDRAARFCHIVFKIFHWLAGRFCSYLLPKQVLWTHEEKYNAIWHMIGCDKLQVWPLNTHVLVSY